jgi:hypothetical protein
MRYRSTLLLRKTGLGALVALLFALGTGAAQAQLPVFDGLDWLLDRGNVSFDAATSSGLPLRPGTNNINQIGNNPGHAVRKWVFPRTFDLTNGTSISPTTTVDNANAADPLNYSDTTSKIVRTSAIYATQTGLDPQQMAHSSLNGVWSLPLVPADATVNDYRSPSRGFSLTTDASQTYSFDYAHVLATHNDFLVTDDTGTSRPATAGELASMPYASTFVYTGVQNALVNDTHPTATYSSGAYNLLAGNYGVDIYSPGDGTKIGGIVHPNVTRAFVRVSWFRTVDANGNIVKANTEVPQYSRIYEVDLGQPGWIHLQGGGDTPAVFPFSGDPRDQIAVTIYSITPDTYSGANDPVFGAAPLVTADAVRFVARTSGSPALGPITPSGRILGPAVGTNKLLNTAAGVAIADVQPLVFFAREESVQDPTPRIPTDPTLPISATNPLIVDPTATITAPVFYCVDSQFGNVVGGDGDGYLPSIGRVRWRYVGIADASNGSGTSAASPAVANVRCRDGVTRTIVYFMTTNTAGTLGHIYAFDAAGNRPTATTQNYWIYPSFRPRTLAELAADKVPAEYHDPNYKSSVVAPYPANAWGADAADPFFHYDGEIVKNPANAGEFIVRSDTRLPTFGGMQGSPAIIDDPSAPAGGQILVIGNLNGRVYAFDAGGRGDFDPAVPISTGTTQRIWTWPHFGADAYYARNLTGTNNIVDETSLGTILGSVAYDPNYNSVDLTRKPIMVPGGDGHLYAINGPHDVVPAYNAATAKATWTERRNWVYPALDTTGLGGALSTPAIFQPAGATFPYLYFTCEGRAYALQEVPPVIAATPPTVNTLKWVFPSTPNPPNSDPNNDATAPLDPGFNGTAPVLMAQGTLNLAGAFAGSPFVTNDFCYVLQGNSTLIGLNALTGALLASGTTQTGSTTSSSPIATQLLGLPNDTGTTVATTNSQPAVVFGDDAGAIFGLAARPDTGQTGPLGGFLLGQIWHHYEVQQSRIAAPALVDGLILQGDEGGQMRAYGIGTGADGLGETVPGEPAEIALGAGNLSIDLRVVDIFKKVDYDLMMLTSPPGSGGKRTANRKNAGGGYTNSALPATGNILNNSTAYASDWGDTLYVVAAGVYHAQPTDDPANPLHGTNAPRIHVTFTMTQNGTVSIFEGDVPAATQPVHGTPGQLWPDDLALTAAEHDALAIYGIDPNGGMPAAQLLTGRNQNVYPWIFKYAIPIYPGSTAANGGTSSFLPGTSNTTITAHAEIYQDLASTDTATMVTTPQPNQSAGTPTYRVGQADYNGLNGPFQTPFTNYAVLGTPRVYAITNPISLTTRGINATDMTGATNRNVVGMFPGINFPGPRPANVGELLGNGNRQIIPGVTSASSPRKSVFAPLPMVPDGSTSTYKAVDNLGNPQDAFYIVDRSNYYGMRARTLQVQVLTHKGGWHGWSPSLNPTSTGSAVMNPLPWEQLPTDGQDSLDYPSIPTTAFSIRKNTGEDAVSALVALTPPQYAGGNQDARTTQATPFSLQLKVPKFQPANVNYGVHTFNGVTFGSAYVDQGDVKRGDPSAATAYDRDVLGPLITNTGNQAALGSSPAYPAAGYVGDLIVRTIPTGLPRAAAGYNPQSFFNAARGGGNAGVTEAFRAMEFGIAVPPGVKMRVAESTLDAGKMPHGTGYTPLTNLNNARSFQVPFVPDMSPAVAGPFYWDNPNLGGEFFRPFTLYNESNVNLVNLRVAKLLGQNFSKISGRSLSQYTDITAGNENTADAVSLQIHSDQVNGQSVPPLYALPFKNISGAPGVGNAGMVSSFDHMSSSSNPTTSLFPERALWPLANPFVVQADIDSATQNYGALFPTADSLANGIVGWKDGIQPQPTLGKPRVGDTQGRIASIPDLPYSGNPALLSPSTSFQRPRIGMAIPMGTPVGTYSAPVFTYEDSTPLQWQEWLSHYSKPAGVTQNYAQSNDGILNVSRTGAPIEAHTDPTFTLKWTVREAKLSREVTNGDLQMLDPFNSWNDPLHAQIITPPGSDLFPAAYMAPGTGSNVYNRNLFLYWATNRRLSKDAPTSGPTDCRRPSRPTPWRTAVCPRPTARSPEPTS